VPLLEIDAVQVSREAFRLGPASLRVEAGRCAAILGPNGAGKSTLLALATGALAPERGSVTSCGDPVAGLARDEIARRIGALAPAAHPSFDLRVLDVVLHGRWAHQRGWHFAAEEDVSIARDALRRVGCAALEARDARTLSSGELQRVLLAKVLAQQAAVLVLDEPTASLDPAQRATVRVLLQLAREAGLGIIIVTHDLDLAAAICDEVLLLRDGRTIAAGDPSRALSETSLSEAYGIPMRVERLAGGRLHIEVAGG
jgi:iron complex transport system ATP-binding protein